MSQTGHETEADALKRAILRAVKEAPTIKGLAVSDVANKLGVPRPTVYSYMEKLAAAGILGYTTVGKTKIYLNRE